MATNPTFRWYWLARLGSHAGDQIARTALLIAVFDRYGPRAVGWMLLASAAPWLLSPVLGRLADRIDLRRLMVGCDVAQTAIYLVLALVVPALPTILVLTAAGTALATVFAPAGRRLMPGMVDWTRLSRANARLGLALNAGNVAGPLLGGLLFAATGLRGALLVNAGTFVLSAVLLSTRGFRLVARNVAHDRVADSVLDDLRAGLRVVWSIPTLRVVSLTLPISVVFGALGYVAVVPLGLGRLHVDDVLVGLLVSAYEVGMVVAPVLLLVRRSYRPERLLLFGLLGFGGGIALTAVSPVLGLALCGLALAGAGNSWQNVANNVLIQQKAPPDRLSAVFGTVYTAVYASEVVGFAVGGSLLAMVGTRWVFTLAGIGMLGVALVAYPLLVSAGRGPRADPDEAFQINFAR